MKTQTLQRQFRLWTVLLLVVPSLLIMMIYTVGQIKVAEQENLELVRQRVYSQERLIDYWMAERAIDVKDISDSEVFRTLDEQKMQHTLYLVQTANRNFDSLSYIDQDGFFRMSTLSSGIQYPKAFEQPYYQAALAGKEYISDVVIGRNSGLQIINFSSPNYDYDGNFKGLILGSVKTKTLEMLLRENWIGKTGEVFLVNREGTMLTEPRHVDEFTAKSLVEDSSRVKFRITENAFQNIRLGESGTATWIDYRGNNVLGAYLTVPERSWTLIGKIDEEEVLNPIYNQLMLMAGGTLLLVLLILPLVTLITNRIKNPIEWLIRQSNLVAVGDYAMAGRDKYSGKMPRELGNLCETFVNMNREIENTVHLLQKNELKLESKVLQIQDINTRLQKEITERQAIQKALETQVAREQLVATLSTKLANCKMNRLGRSIRLALADVGRFFNVSASFAYLSSEKEGAFKLKYHWCSEQTCWDGETGANCLTFEKYPWVIRRLKEAGQLYIDADTIPDYAIAERKLINAMQIKSMVLFPMSRGSHLMGFFGIVSIGEKTIWQEDQEVLMKVAGDLILNAVERQRIFQALSKSETDNRALVESIPDILLRISSRGRILSARIENKDNIFARTQLSGCSLATVLPKPVAELYCAAITRALAQGKLQKIEYNMIDHSATRYRETRIVPTRDNTVLAVVRDITEQKKTAEDLAKVRDMIVNAQRMASLGIMAGSIAHEINQPLNSIKVSASGMLYLMQQGVLLETEDFHRELSRIVNETERIEGVISKTRWIVREGLPYKGPLLIDKVILDVLTLIKDQDLFKDVKIDFQLAPLKAWIAGNKIQIEQLLLHLLTNAAQALEDQNHPEKVINISVQVADQVIISVSDNGPGLERAAFNDIFEPFFTTKRTEENMGLGLAIVQSITYAHNGQIVVANNREGGATFSVSFPLLEDLSGTKRGKMDEDYVSG